MDRYFSDAVETLNVPRLESRSLDEIFSFPFKLQFAMSPAGLKTQKRGDQCIDILTSVVEGQ
jgi:hypothetical protein